MTGIRIDTETLKAALGPSADCPSIEELAKLADGGAAKGARRTAEHVAGCVRCRTELALLAEFEAAAPRPEEELAARWITARLENDVARMTSGAPERSLPAQARAPRRWNPRTALRPAIAVLALAASILVVVNLRGRGGEAPALSPDAGASPSVFRSNAVTLVAPVDDVAQAPAELRWEPVPGATSYSVTLTEVDRTEVWRTDVRGPEAPLPPAVRARIVPGKPLLWQVAAKDASGAVVATSGTQRFRVPLTRPPAHP